MNIRLSLLFKCNKKSRISFFFNKFQELDDDDELNDTSQDSSFCTEPEKSLNSISECLTNDVHRTKKPDALQFQQSLKAVCISEFESSTKGSYTCELSDESNSFDYLSMIKDYNEKEKENETIEPEIIKILLPEDISDRDLFCGIVQRFAFHREISSIISKNITIIGKCDDCTELISLVKKENGNFKLSSTAMSFFALLECCFRMLSENMATSHKDFKGNFIENAATIRYFDHCLPNQELLICCFYEHRSKVSATRREKHRANFYGSKSLIDITIKAKAGD